MPTPPRNLALGVSLAVLGAGGAAVVWALARFWGANPGHADRFLVLAAAGWVAWNARADLRALPAKPTRAGWVPLAAGAVAFPVGWFLHAQVSPRAVTLWWLMTAWLSAAAGVVLLAGGWGRLRRLAFPLIFVPFALPIPSRALVPLQHHLQTATTSAAEAALPRLGVPVERHGFVLALPGGDLGVAEACSGVRSVTALTAIAAFVAHLFGFGPVRGLVLVGLTVPVVAAVNAARVIATGLIQEHAGPRYIQGAWHEALGAGMVFVGLGAVLALAKAVGRGRPLSSLEAEGDRSCPSPLAGEGGPGSAGPGEGTSGEDEDAAPLPARKAEPPSPAAGGGGTKLAAVLLLAAAATGFAQFLGRAAEEELVADAPIREIPYALGPWAGRDLPVPEFIPEMLTYDAAVHRVYTRDLGYEAGVWVIFWSSRNMVRGYHHPDVCLPSRGAKILTREAVPVPLPGGGEIPVTVREVGDGRDRQLVLYWTQEGRRVWTDDDERAAMLTGGSHGWVGDRLFGAAGRGSSGRLAVLVGTPLWGDGQTIRTQTLDLCASLAAAVFDTCPWADIRAVPR